jgi:hypothetical protein
MNNIGPSISTISNSPLIANPIVKPATGLEDTDTKQDIFSAVEETSETSANKASPDSNAPENNASARPNQNQSGSDHSGPDQSGPNQSGQDQSGQDQQDQEQSEQELAIIRDLSARDREVRAHEQAHASVGGQYAGAASFTYQRGPNGVSYAVGGEVPISAPSGGDAQSRLQAAEQIKRAALAPANPSAQDRQVAAQATQTATQARAEIVTQSSEQRSALSSDEEAISESEGAAKNQAETEPNTPRESDNNSGTQAFKNVTNASDVGSILNQLA